MRFERGYCQMHYRRLKRRGAPGEAEKIGRAAPVQVRFENHVQLYGPILDIELGPCAVWTGYVHAASGFGLIGVDYRSVYAHRMAWELAYGYPPPSQLFQMCGNRLCVRVDHLKLLG